LNTVERCIELARSGRYRSIEEIRKQVANEGCNAVDEHLSGTLFKSQLRALIADAKVPESSEK
jgi:hypothetical protein